MPDEATGAETHSGNGVSTSVDMRAASRAAFLSGEDDAKPEGKAGKVESIEREADDDDSDLDDEIEGDSEAEEASADESDDEEDSDLDEDDDKPEADEKDLDDDTKKGIDKVRRTERRMREQLKKERADAEADLDAKVRQADRELEQKWGKRIEAAERFERLSARVNGDALGVLKELGFAEDGYEALGQILYTLAKAKDDPKAKAAAHQLMRDRERDDKVAELAKWREDREKADREREAATADEKKWDAYFDRVAKAAGDKTPLAKAWLKANPEAARERMHVITAKLARDGGGKIPQERAVMIALEKDRRRTLRDLGIDPKTRSAIAASGDVVTDTKKTATKGDKKVAKDVVKTDDKKLSTKDEFIRLNGKYD